VDKLQSRRSPMGLGLQEVTLKPNYVPVLGTSGVTEGPAPGMAHRRDLPCRYLL
jgi:hypothetical protein